MSCCYSVMPDDPILHDPSIQKIEGYVSVNYMYDNESGIIIYTNNKKVFQEAKYIFILSDKGTINVPIIDIKFYEVPNGEKMSFGGPFKITYYVSNENTKNLLEFKLRS